MKYGLLITLVLALLGCDTALEDANKLVVEAYFQPGHPLPDVHLSRSVALQGAGSPLPESGAIVEVTIEGTNFVYRESAELGRYSPLEARRVEVGESFRLRATSRGDVASATGVIPPSLTLDSIRVDVPEESIAAVLVDSLSLLLDSLAFEVPSRTGYIYPVEVTLWWKPARTAREDFWIETTLQPVERFSSRLIDFFLRPSSVLDEPSDGPEQLMWRGLYAVPVANETDPLPPHYLNVAAVRGTLDYARFALSRGDPDQREPVGNVTGGLGLVTGIALDSMRVYVQ